MKFIHRLFLPFENNWNPWGRHSLRVSLLLALAECVRLGDICILVLSHKSRWPLHGFRSTGRGQPEGPLWDTLWPLATVLATCPESSRSRVSQLSPGSRSVLGLSHSLSNPPPPPPYLMSEASTLAHLVILVRLEEPKKVTQTHSRACHLLCLMHDGPLCLNKESHAFRQFILKLIQNQALSSSWR